MRLLVLTQVARHLYLEVTVEGAQHTSLWCSSAECLWSIWDVKQKPGTRQQICQAHVHLRRCICIFLFCHILISVSLAATQHRHFYASSALNIKISTMCHLKASWAHHITARRQVAENNCATLSSCSVDWKQLPWKLLLQLASFFSFCLPFKKENKLLKKSFSSLSRLYLSLKHFPLTC